MSREEVLQRLQTFLFNLSNLDGLNCPDTRKEFDVYSQGFQDAKSAMQVFVNRLEGIQKAES